MHNYTVEEINNLLKLNYGEPLCFVQDRLSLLIRQLDENKADVVYQPEFDFPLSEEDILKIVGERIKG
jgi:hypothetical protein